MMFAFLVTLLSFWVTFVVSQTTHQVVVGRDGTFYDPPTVSAVRGDTVQFIFEGQAHTVTQSNATNPCQPLPGGFSSGIAGLMTSQTGNPPVWNLVIEDDTQPIWYFCQLTQPSSHCATGMVGVINPPSIPVYKSVQAAAKAVSGTPKPSLFVSLSGDGAAATNSPIAPSSAISLSVSETPSSVLSSTSASTASSTPASTSSSFSAAQPDTTTSSGSSTSHSKTGTIVGAAVGGAVGLVILLTMLAICWRRQNAKDIESSNNQFFQYHVTPSPPMQERSMSATKTATSFASSGTPGMLIPARRRNSLEESTISNGMSDVGVVVPPLAKHQQPPSRNPSAQAIPRQASNQNVSATVMKTDAQRGHTGDSSVVSSASPIVPPRPLPVFPHPYSGSGANPAPRRPVKESELVVYNPDVGRSSLVDSALEGEFPAPPLYRVGNN